MDVSDFASYYLKKKKIENKGSQMGHTKKIFLKRLKSTFGVYLLYYCIISMGHGELLELRLLEKSARHNFIIARHHSSNNIFSCHLLESSYLWELT
jgi:hypothetical protein